PELIFVLGIRMSFYFVIPRIDVPDNATVVSQVSGGTHENSTGMHELAPGKIDRQTTYPEQMYIKDCSDIRRYLGCKGYQIHGKFFDTKYIYSKHIAHQNTAAGNSQQ